MSPRYSTSVAAQSPDSKAPFIRLIHCTHEQQLSPACVHTRSIRSCRGCNFSEPEGNECFCRTLKGSNGPSWDVRLTSADCRSKDRSTAYQTAEYHPGEERRVHPLESAKVSKLRSVSSFGACPKVVLRNVRLVLDDQRPAIRNRCLTLLDEEDDVVRLPFDSVPLADW